MAESASPHRNYVGGVQRGERNVSLVNITKLVHGLGVKPVSAAMLHFRRFRSQGRSA